MVSNNRTLSRKGQLNNLILSELTSITFARYRSFDSTFAHKCRSRTYCCQGPDENPCFAIKMYETVMVEATLKLTADIFVAYLFFCVETAFLLFMS